MINKYVAMGLGALIALAPVAALARRWPRPHGYRRADGHAQMQPVADAAHDRARATRAHRHALGSSNAAR